MDGPDRALLDWPMTASFAMHCARNPASRSPGLDLAMPVGTPAPAPADGRVIGWQWSDSGGRILVLREKQGREWWLMHLQGALAAVGEEVARGQVVATSGNTGGHTTGPHLHLSLRVDGRWVDPERALLAS